MSGERYRLLIADDDRLLRESMRMALRAQFETILVADGLKALEVFRQERVDAVILDGSMPGMTGQEVCREIRSLPEGRHLPICIVSSAESDSAVDTAFEAGATDYLRKPVHLGLLGRKLQHLIHRSIEEARQHLSLATDSLFNILPVPLALVDKGGRILKGNPAFHEQMGSESADGPIGDVLRLDPQPNFDCKPPVRIKTSAFCLKTSNTLELTLVPMPGAPSARWVAVLLDAPLSSPMREVPASPAQNLRGRRVLVLEDQDVVARSIDRLLTRAGCRVSITNQGCDTINVYESARALGQPFDVVILDLSIPGGIGGTEVVLKLAEIDPNVRAIASSGSWDDAAMLSPAAHGFVGSLPKPFDREQLLHEVARAIAS